MRFLIVFLIAMIISSCDERYRIYRESTITSSQEKVESLQNELAALKLTMKEISEREQEYEIISFINPKISRIDSIQIVDAIEKNFVETGIDKDMLLTICAIESNLIKESASPTGDHGICQINKLTYKQFVKAGLINDEWNKIYTISYNMQIAALILKMNKQSIDKVYRNYSESTRTMMLILSYNKGLQFIEEAKITAQYIARYEKKFKQIKRMK